MARKIRVKLCKSVWGTAPILLIKLNACIWLINLKQGIVI